MATDTSGTAPHTALVPGGGSSTATYTLPAGLYQYIQSVVATVDTTGSGAVTPLLTIRDDGGEVVADQRQDDSLDAGGVRRSTWALGLRNGGGGIRFGRDNIGSFLTVETTGSDGVLFDVHGGFDFTVSMDGPTGTFEVDAPKVLMDTSGGDYTLRNLRILAIDAVQETTTVGASGITTTTTGTMTDTANTLDVNVSTNEAHTVTGSFIVTAGDIELDGPTTVHGGALQVTIPSGGAATFFDHLGNPIFKINEDGSLQGKTGKALTFNL